MCTGGQICPDKNEFTCDMQNSREFTCNGEESRELANSPRAEKRRVLSIFPCRFTNTQTTLFIDYRIIQKKIALTLIIDLMRSKR